MKKKIWHWPLWMLLFAAGCEVINPSEEIPAFLYVENFVLETEPVTEGTNSSNITEVWLTVDGNFLGAYSLPALIPVLASGEAQVRLDAGIKDNGIRSRSEIYPFYEPWEQTMMLTPEKIDTIAPVIGYRDNARFALIEGFESSAHAFQDLRIGSSGNRIRLTDTEVFEGNSSGLFFVDTTNALVEIATTERYADLNASSPLVYLEVNYKSDVPVVFGVVGYGGNQPDGTTNYDPGFNPRGDWNKIYFNLSEIVFQGGFTEHQVVLQAFIPVEGGQLTLVTGNIWLDNIKLVHF